MALPLIVNGITYEYPQNGEKQGTWGQQATAWASAVTAGMLQKAGGLFTLTAEADFGAVHGLKSLYFKGRNANPASAGQVRLSFGDAIKWRNAANNGDLSLNTGGSDRLLFQGVDLLSNANGNVTGPVGATDNALPRYDGITGQLIKNSGVLVDNSNNMTVPGNVIAGPLSTNLLMLVPIGTIIPWWDFNGSLSLDTTHWAFCNGQTVTVAGVGSVALPDLSAAFLQGYGTPGGGDIGSAAWSPTAEGNTANTANLQHSHTVNAHSHAISSDGSHDHTVDSHTHDFGTLFALIEGDAAANTIYSSVGSLSWNSQFSHSTNGHTNPDVSARTSATLVRGNTGSAAPTTSVDGAHNHTGATGSETPGTSNSLSTTQEIRPRSNRVRYIMRIA